MLCWISFAVTRLPMKNYGIIPNNPAITQHLELPCFNLSILTGSNSSKRISVASGHVRLTAGIHSLAAFLVDQQMAEAMLWQGLGFYSFHTSNKMPEKRKVMQSLRRLDSLRLPRVFH